MKSQFAGTCNAVYALLIIHYRGPTSSKTVFASIIGGYNEMMTSSLTSNPPLWPPFCSLEGNKLGAKGGKAIGEALKVNTSITDIQ